MSGLLKKEIRLLLPSWIAAMLLAIAPIPLGRLIDQNEPTGVTNLLSALGVAIGCVILGLTGMGREFTSRTFSLLLTQPHPREKSWQAKIRVMLAALGTLALFVAVVNLPFAPPPDRWEVAGIWFLTACVAVTGGLWTTLLLRQIVAAFWISLLLPFGLLALAVQLDYEPARTILMVALLLVYSAAGYWFARWQFCRAQDVAWTGGEVTLSVFARWLPRTHATTRQPSHPFRTLVAKEFQFQQVNFLLGGLLLAVQGVMLLLQRFGNWTDNSVVEMMVQNFWGIWIIMPLLVGCGSVAEERKLGTLESQLCLPVSRAWQFAIKVFVTAVCGVLLGALVPVGLSLANPTRGMNFQEFALPWILGCASLALVSLYASTLTHQILQALGAAIGILVAVSFLVNLFAGNFSGRGAYFSLFGVNLWRGPLIFLTTASVMLLFTMMLTWRPLRWVWSGFLALLALGLWSGWIQAFVTFCLTVNAKDYAFKPIAITAVLAALCPVAFTLALAAQNFKHVQTSFTLWWRNLLLWLVCVALTCVANGLVYNRAWELLMRFEPVPGPPSLVGDVRPIIIGSSPDQRTFVLLPDGRLCSYQGYQRMALPEPDRRSGVDSIFRVIENPQVEFLAESNWMTITRARYELAGVKLDGTLWRATWFELVDQQGNRIPFAAGHPGQKGAALRTTATKFERIGGESDWLSVASGWSHFAALKRDGTIWGWGGNANKQLGDAADLFNPTPVQIGSAAHWKAIFAGNGHTYAVNQEGTIWKWGRFATDPYRHNMEEGPVSLKLRVPGVRSISSEQGQYDLILDTDGKLWGLGNLPPALLGNWSGGWGSALDSREGRQLPGADWLTINCTWNSLAGLRADGTLWVLRGENFYNWPLPELTQYGQRNDWIAVLSDWESDLALAKDGTLCRFGKIPSHTQLELIAPTRRVTWKLSLLGAAK